MNKQEIKQTWKQLIIPFVLGILILIAGILWSRLGSGRPEVQAKCVFVSLFGIVLSTAAGRKIIKFKKHLRENDF